MEVEKTIEIPVAIIGCSPIAEIHAEALRGIDGVTLKACAEVNPESLDKFSKKFGLTPYLDYRELLKREQISVVILCLPHFLHLPIALDVIKAKKHLILEKPIARNVKEAKAIINTCHRKKLILAVIYQNRFLTASRELKRIISDNKLGRLMYAHVSVEWHRDHSYYEKSRWRATVEGAGGGVLMVQAIHMFDLLQWLLGDPTEVYGNIQTLFQKIEVEDWACGWIKFGSGIIADFRASTLHYPEQPAFIKIVGEKGSAFLQEKRGFVSLDVNFINGDSIKIEPPKSLEGVRNQNGTSPSLLQSEGHKSELEGFFLALREGRSPEIDGREAIKSLSLIENIYLSSRKKKPLMVKDICKGIYGSA